jgi:hypothetical protein
VGTRGRVSGRRSPEPGTRSTVNPQRGGPATAIRRPFAQRPRSPLADQQPGEAYPLKRDVFQAVLGVLDQGVTALGSLIPVVLLGRMAGAHQLGIFSLAVSAALFVAI